jgi:phosphopentomutase
MEFDLKLPEILSSLKEDDLLIITADHGNDPTAPGTDHTREYVPILHYGAMVQENQNIGVRQSFADMAATIADALAVDLETKGESYLELILKN